MQTHDLKILPEYFEAILDGCKTDELRREDDRTFAVGDELVLREFVKTDMDLFDIESSWVPAGGGYYTGRSITVEVTYVLRDPVGRWLQPGVVALSLRKVEEESPFIALERMYRAAQQMTKAEFVELVAGEFDGHTDYAEGCWPQWCSSPLGYMFSRNPISQGRRLFAWLQDKAKSDDIANRCFSISRAKQS